MSDMHDAVRTPPAAPQDLTGTTVGRFNILARLGVGGMGEVYRADDTKLRRTVAIKRMAPRVHGDPIEAARLLREGQRASALNHPNIAAIYDVIEEKGEILLVMEYIEGKTLRERMWSPISMAEFLAIAMQCSEGLAAAIAHECLKQAPHSPKQQCCVPHCLVPSCCAVPAVAGTAVANSQWRSYADDHVVCADRFVLFFCVGGRHDCPAEY